MKEEVASGIESWDGDETDTGTIGGVGMTLGIVGVNVGAG